MEGDIESAKLKRKEMGQDDGLFLDEAAIQRFEAGGRLFFKVK